VKSPRDTRDLIEKTGLALYGPGWRPELADRLGISPRSLRRFLAEPEIIPSGVWNDLGTLIMNRRSAMSHLLVHVVAAKDKAKAAEAAGA
jgi:hypothetical protein